MQQLPVFYQIGMTMGADPGRKLECAGQNRTADLGLAEGRSWVSADRRRGSFQSHKARRRPLSYIVFAV